MKDTSKNTIGRTRNVARKRLAVYFLSQIFRSLAAFDLMIVPLLRLHRTFYRRMDYTMVKKEKTASRKIPGVSFIGAVACRQQKQSSKRCLLDLCHMHP